MKRRFYFSLIVFLTLVSCGVSEGESYTRILDEKTIYYESGEKKGVGSMKGESRDGEWTYYYENGNKMSQGSYVDDLQEGEWEAWYESGKIMQKALYQNGVQHGEASTDLFRPGV